MSNKKAEQLGMNPSTATGRLTKDVLYHLVCKTGQNKCFHCGEEMSRDSFSIEHKTPWLDSEDPVKLFFDLENISFSHLSCNSKASRKPPKMSPEERISRKREIDRLYRRKKRAQAQSIWA